MLAAETTVLLKLDSFRMFLFVLCATVIDPTTLGTFKLYIFTHLIISFVIKAPDRS